MNRKQILALVKSFIAQYDLDLQNAVFLLGGSAALMRLQRFRRSLSASNATGVRLHRELNWLHELLSLENVGDPYSEEAGCFSMINPEDPVVWNICILTEAVSDLISDVAGIRAAGNDRVSEVAA